jgi:hypothetical protein
MGKYAQEVDMMADPKVCQSCAMPLRRDEDHGSNADGSINMDYCKHCYQNGKFTDEGITMEQKIDKLVSLAKNMSIGEEQTRAMAQSILPMLKRWKKQ